MGRIEIVPSLLAADFACLEESIQAVEKAGADGLHLDIMDGHFVPNISFGPVVVSSIRRISKLPFWAHLMIEHPKDYLEPFRRAGVQGIFFHVETVAGIDETADRIHAMGLLAGIAVNPETDIGTMDIPFEKIERILIMTVHPGFGGQTFLEDQIEKIKNLRKRIDSLKKPVRIGVDGGIEPSTVMRTVRAGADVLIAGSAIFRAKDPAESVGMMRSLAEKAIANKGKESS